MPSTPTATACSTAGVPCACCWWERSSPPTRGGQRAWDSCEGASGSAARPAGDQRHLPDHFPRAGRGQMDLGSARLPQIDVDPAPLISEAHLPPGLDARGVGRAPVRSAA
jgi:hypothetical protein